MAQALKVENVSFNYGEKRALKGVNFALEKGRFCALLGPNGAGKSTLFSLLTRLFVTREGRIEVAGFDLAKNPRKALSRMGVVFQQPTLDLDMTVARNMSYFAALHGLAGREAQRRIDEALDRLDMRARAGEKARALNGGHRRRMEIARALVHQPEVLLLDEPTVGLDTASRRAITDHVHDLAGGGLTVFWATHLVDEIWPQDDCIVLHRGEVLIHDKAATVAGDRPLIDAFIDMTGSETAA
ncbi:ABC-2 type transport system ATP-binding protein [Poseidonocella pacifica]|uniref:ABC-2 type transport system ATP-binding protein n=1 Tax=Poseidonocella pacifica TaxID=871651 RepID=A0A1I0YIF9_9RHOB|nr:ABC transporter ATP-binding protein [Poseidonocella pacifica]SFB12546.1 ABC-2 type transport system ATP-binding protein [Poseidonocella pacifica]